MIELSGKQWLLIIGACVLLFALIGFRIASTPRPPESQQLSPPTRPQPAGEAAPPAATTEAPEERTPDAVADLPVLAEELIEEEPPEPPRPARRLQWEIETAGGKDSFVELLAAGNRLLAMRKGVLYAFDAATGTEAWRFPEEGRATGYGDARYSGGLIFIYGQARGHVFTRLPNVQIYDKTGIIAIRLSDGAVVEEFIPALKFHHSLFMRYQMLDTCAVLWAKNKDYTRAEFSVIDVAEWREMARFEIHHGIVGDPQVWNGSLYGMLQRKGEEFCRAFRLDLRRGTLYSVATRTKRNRQPSVTILPDGGMLTPEGRVGPRCAFERPFPERGPLPFARYYHGAGGGLYVRDELGFCRLDPKTGRELWRFPMANEPIRSYVVVAGGGHVVLAERGYLYVLGTETGRLVLAIRALDDDSSIQGIYWLQQIVLDRERIYYSSPTGLRVYSLTSLDAEKPDPEDPGDPAYVIAKARARLVQGDFEGGLHALRGIGTALAARPSLREEVGELLSQLSRSPATTLHPELWEKVVDDEGWVAGELFLEDYARRYVARSLIALGTRNALRTASGFLKEGKRSLLAAEATRTLKGGRPVVEHAAHGRIAAAAAVNRPLDDASFRRLLPFLEQHKKRLRHYLHALTPGQILQLFGDDKVLGAGALLQVRSMTEKRGNVETVKIETPAALPELPPAPEPEPMPPPVLEDEEDVF